MFKVGIVGCGGIGNAHKNAWMQIPGVSVEAVCDIVEDRARAMQESVGGACRYYTDAGEMPDDLDAVSVVTPPYAHFAIVRDLLRRGYNVFCEKPLTMDPEQCRALDKLAAKNGCELGVGFKMRFEPIFQQARRYVPLVGRVNSIVTTKLQAFNPRPEGAWVTRTGAMYELSIHDFDLISYITGLYPEKVEFADIGHRFGWEKDDAFHLAVRYDGGVTALLQGMYAVSSTFCYRDLTITVLGDQGYVRIERPDRIIVHTDHYEVVEIPAAEKNAFVCELEHFKGACEGRWKNTLTAESATRMTDMIEEARRLGEN